MQFIKTVIFAATALASMATANTVHFVNQDSTDRTIYFTPEVDHQPIDSLSVPGLSTANQIFPTNWIGNFYSVSAGAKNVPGMLGEVRWNGYAGSNFFDVSAIVNPNDAQGVKEIFPMTQAKPISGCQTFPCANAYNKPDDIATLSTTDTELVCLIGNLSNERKRGLVAKMNRDFITS